MKNFMTVVRVELNDEEKKTYTEEQLNRIDQMTELNCQGNFYAGCMFGIGLTFLSALFTKFLFSKR